MNIIYNKEGVPFIIEEDQTIIEFTSENRNFIIGELATEKNTIDLLFNNVSKRINETIDEYKNANKDTFYQLRITSDILRKINYFIGIIDICAESEILYYKLTTPKEYESWIWNHDTKQWIPPWPPPAGEIDEIYSWDEDNQKWSPIEEYPGEGYIWGKNHTWEPMVKYPIDAEPGEFVWDEDSFSWVLANSK